MILVSGGAGKTGQAVIAALSKKGQQVRAFIRSTEQVEKMKHLGAIETFVGDLINTKDYIQAANGISKIYHICPNVNAFEIEIGENLLQAAKAANIEQIVYHSVLHPQIEAMPHHWLKMRVEEKIFESGFHYTILQPTAYMQNVLNRFEEIIDQGVYKVPYSIRARNSLVDLKDVAEVAAKVLIESGHFGATYELVGPDYLNAIEVAERISILMGKEVFAKKISLSEWRANAEKAGLDNYGIETLIKMFQYYDQHSLRGNHNVLSLLLGRKPISFTEFLQREVTNKSGNLT